MSPPQPCLSDFLLSHSALIVPSLLDPLALLTPWMLVFLGDLPLDHSFLILLALLGDPVHTPVLSYHLSDTDSQGLYLSHWIFFLTSRSRCPLNIIACLPHIKHVLVKSELICLPPYTRTHTHTHTHTHTEFLDLNSNLFPFSSLDTMWVTVSQVWLYWPLFLSACHTGGVWFLPQRPHACFSSSLFLQFPLRSQQVRL